MGAYSHVEYELYKPGGEKYYLKDPYAICDGGYHKWRHMMSASRLISDPDFIIWRKRLESVRKDIENFFGRMKNRFRCLKLPIEYHSKEQIDNMFFTCVGLQNMLHDWDEHDTFANGMSWANRHGDFEDLGEHWGVPTYKGMPVTADADYSRFGKFHFSEEQEVHFGEEVEELSVDELVTLQTERDASFYDLQTRLVISYKEQLKRGNVFWVR